MNDRLVRASALMILAGLMAASPFARAASAQEGRSEALAKELTTLLTEKKLDSFAAKHPGAADQFVAALFFPGQLLVVWARYSVPAVLSEKIARHEFRDVYIDLNAASIPESKVLITDLGADGLKPKRLENQPFDSSDAPGKSILFDGNWREDKMSEQDYMKAFAEAEAAYANALETLVASIKKQES